VGKYRSFWNAFGMQKKASFVLLEGWKHLASGGFRRTQRGLARLFSKGKLPSEELKLKQKREKKKLERILPTESNIEGWKKDHMARGT